ncbi:Atherinlike, partial [Caligus rogercresseyi]
GYNGYILILHSKVRPITLPSSFDPIGDTLATGTDLTVLHHINGHDDQLPPEPMP